MAYKENLIGRVSVDTTVDHSANQYKFVTAGGALAAANGGDALGVNQDALNGAVDGPKPLFVGYLGISKVQVDGNTDAIAVGDLLTCDAAGKGISKGGLSTGDIALGEALAASTADDDIIPVLLNSARCGQQN